MKKLFAAVLFLSSSFVVHAQTNLLNDGGFETFNPGYKGFITITSGKVKGMTGKWQMVFAKGGCPEGCGRGSAEIVTSQKNTGKNSIEIKIDTQANRNDIRLLQTVANVPAGVYEISFFAKSDVPSPIAVDALRSTQQSTNNGAMPFTGSFNTTTQWLQYKITVDVNDWTDEERNDFRVSIRVNNNKDVPHGPYPKTFWIDDVVLVKK